MTFPLIRTWFFNFEFYARETSHVNGNSGRPPSESEGQPVVMYVYNQTFRWLHNLTDVITDDSRRLFFVNGKHITDQRHSIESSVNEQKILKETVRTETGDSIERYFNSIRGNWRPVNYS